MITLLCANQSINKHYAAQVASKPPQAAPHPRRRWPYGAAQGRPPPAPPATAWAAPPASSACPTGSCSARQRLGY